MRQVILVTGGAGYIGSVLVGALVKQGKRVRVFDSLYFGKQPLAHLVRKLDLIAGDIRTIPNQLFRDVHTVIHLAGLSNDPTAEFNPKLNFAVNAQATQRLAEQAKAQGVARLIYASSCSIYDREGDPGNRLRFEDSPVSPQRAYSISKYHAECELLKLVDRRFCVVILRKGTVFGFSPRMRFDLIVNTMVKSALQDKVINVLCGGRQWRPLVDVEDTAEAYAKALAAPAQRVNAQILNITYRNFRVSEVAQRVQRTLKEHFGISVPIVHRQPNARDRSYRVSTKKARELLRFQPKRSIEASVVEMVNTLNANGIMDFDNPLYHNIHWMEPILKEESQRSNKRR